MAFSRKMPAGRIRCQTLLYEALKFAMITAAALPIMLVYLSEKTIKKFYLQAKTFAYNNKQ